MRFQSKFIAGFFCFCAFLFFSYKSLAQPQRTLPVTPKFIVTDGSYEGSYLVMENINTGEKQTIKGVSKFNLNLKFNSEYILSFSKPGYITKRMQINTAVQQERIEQGFYPVNFEVILMKQYEGVNIVVFNQPVGIYRFSKLMDEFFYDTDYTKQVQSAIKDAEDELKAKKEEEKRSAEQAKKDAEKARLDSVENAKSAAKAKADSIALARKDALAKAEEDRKAKVVADEEAKKLAKTQADEEAKKKAREKLDEEERRKLKAQEDADERTRKAAQLKEEEEAKRKLKIQQDADERARKAAQVKEEEEAKRKAKMVAVAENRPVPIPSEPVGEVEKTPVRPIEMPSNISVEEITEANRTLTKATVTNGNQSHVYTKIVYKWGGIFYFKDNSSISQSMFQLVTKMK